jgi:hypothetical protein
VVKSVYGSIPAFLVEHGFGPGGKNAAESCVGIGSPGGEYL